MHSQAGDISVALSSLKEIKCKIVLIAKYWLISEEKISQTSWYDSDTWL